MHTVYDLQYVTLWYMVSQYVTLWSLWSQFVTPLIHTLCPLNFACRTLFVCIYIIYTVFPRKDAAATIYFSSTAMRRLFEGSYYSKYRRRGYYLFQRYRNAATIRGRLLFEVQTSRLLFISALPQCGDYSRTATIRSTDVVATIYFSATAMWRLLEGGDYSRTATIRSTDVTVTIYFSAAAMR